MNPGRLMALTGTFFVALATVVTADIALPRAVQILLGVLMVFLVPGFAVVSAVLPARYLSNGECLIASLGISLAVVICAGMLLAATPIGLSRVSLAIVIGIGTTITSIYALFRTRLASAATESRECIGRD